MNNIRILTAAMLLLFSGTILGCTQGAGSEWENLNQETMSLYRQGRYSRATVVAQKALEVAEQNVENLAYLYRATNRIEEAEELERRAAQIRAMKR